MIKSSSVLLAAVAILLVASQASAGTVIDNDIPLGTLGHFSVDLTPGSESLPPLGPNPINGSVLTGLTSGGVVSERYLWGLFSYVDIGPSTLAFRLGETALSGSGTGSHPDEFTSAGSFIGSGGNVIQWQATSSIPDLGAVMTTTFTFNALTGTFGDLSFSRYFDEDLFDRNSNVLVPTGSSAAGDLELFVYGWNELIGVSQGAAYSGQQGLSNAEFLGWAADDAGTLRDNIIYHDALYSPTGVIGFNPNLTPHPLFPGQATYGPWDVATAMAFRLDSGATSATIITTLGGVPTRRVNPPNPPNPPAAVPLPGGAWMGLALLGALGLARKARRSRHNQAI